MKLLSTFCLMAISFSALAQGTQTMGTASNTLDASNISATIQTGGDFFTKNPGQTSNSPGFEVPKGSGKHTIFDAALWIGGKDAAGQIYTASQAYRQGIPAQGSYWPGPIGTTQGAAHNAKYDKVWKVSKAQIQAHIANYSSTNYTAPTDIATWPGNGNTANGEAAQLAPFVDVNNDGVYSPNLGDYPKIKGDQALYLILNDKGNIKVPGSPTMNAEIHVMFYGFNTPGSSPIYNTVFSEHRIINRGQINFNNFYAGLWVDFDLGYYNDDFVGSDVTNNRFYAYNGDNDDEGTAGYGTNPPVQSVIFLDQYMSSFVYYNNNNSNPTNGTPQTSQNFYNYLTGIWKDGKYMTFGTDGMNQSQSPYKFMFSGNTDPLGYGYNNPPIPGHVAPFPWTESNLDGLAHSNTPGDRRGVGSIGPFNLNAGQELKFTVAYTFSQGTSAGQDAITVQNFFNNALVNSTKKDLLKQPLLLFPNPATNQLTIQLPSAFENKTARISITDNVGRKVLEKSVVRNSGNQIQLNIEALSKGMYQVTVTSGEETITGKLAKL
jgi:hypothetical protein